MWHILLSVWPAVFAQSSKSCEMTKSSCLPLIFSSTSLWSFFSSSVFAASCPSSVECLYTILLSERVANCILKSIKRARLCQRPFLTSATFDIGGFYFRASSEIEPFLRCWASVSVIVIGPEKSLFLNISRIWKFQMSVCYVDTDDVFTDE